MFSRSEITQERIKVKAKKDYDANRSIVITRTKREADRCAVPPTEKHFATS